MKEVKAFIKKRKMGQVVLALSKISGLTGVSIMDSRGFGRGRGAADIANLNVFDDRLFGQPGVRLEIICHDELAEEVVAAIIKHAHTGLRGDGKIYLSSVETAVRISTGERGEGAV